MCQPNGISSDLKPLRKWGIRSRRGEEEREGKGAGEEGGEIIAGGGIISLSHFKPN